MTRKPVSARRSIAGGDTAATGTRVRVRALPQSGLVGRQHELDLLTGAARDSRGTGWLFLLGEAGAGKTRLLQEAITLLRDRGEHAIVVQATVHDQATPYGLLYKFVSALPCAGRPQHQAAADLLEAVTRINSLDGGDQADLLPRVTKALEQKFTDLTPLNVFIDDAQFIDVHTIELLTALRRRMAVTSCALVFAARSGGDHLYGQGIPEPVLDGVADGHAVAILEPLSGNDIRELTTRVLDAAPDVNLLAYLARSAEGNPGATLDILDQLRAASAVRVVDGQAYLVGEHEPVVRSSPLVLTATAELGENVRRVAAAIAVLGPVGATASRLAGDVLGISRSEVANSVRTLTDRGVLLARPDGGWRLRSEPITAALAASLGPCEQQALATAAARAVLDGPARLVDERWLADQLVSAGELIDRPDALHRLLDAANSASTEDGARAARWYAAALAVLQEPGQRREVLVAQTRLAAGRSLWPQAAASAEEALLIDPEWTDAAAAELRLIKVATAAATGDHSTLLRIATSEPTELPGPAPYGMLARAVALAHLGRWWEARRELDRCLIRGQGVCTDADGCQGGPTMHELALAISHRVDIVLGTMPPRPGQELPGGPDVSARLSVPDAGLLGRRGDPRRPWQVLESNSTPRYALPTDDRIIVGYLFGRWDDVLHAAGTLEAVDLAPAGLQPGLVYQRVVTIHAARGRFGWARAWLARAARRLPECGDPLLAAAEAGIHFDLGDLDAARSGLRAALAKAADVGYQCGLAELYGALVQIEMLSGATTTASAVAAELAQFAADSDDPRTHVVALCCRALVDRQPSLAAAAVKLAQELSHPMETATTSLFAARLGVDPAILLPAAYEQFGALDALVWRARTRTAMRSAGIAVPQREASTVESERLLARLVADGLTNQQIAAVLGTTLKGVEGKLTRLFARTGYRSRVDLAAAALGDAHYQDAKCHD